MEGNRGSRGLKGSLRGTWRMRRKKGIHINREEVTTTGRKMLHDGGGDPCLSIFDYL